MFHRRRTVASINSVKHYVQQPNSAVASGTIRNQVLVDAIAVAAARSNTFDVEEGALVKAVFLDFWCLGTGVTDSNTQINAIIEKVPSNQDPVTALQIVNLGAYPNKKNILNSFQGNQGAQIDGHQALPYLRGWQLIPKGKQRMGLGDRIVMSILSSGNAIAICGQSTYKEYK